MSNDNTTPPPPFGDQQSAQRYVDKLVDLIRSDKVEAAHTDLKKFEPCSLADHYRINLKDYEVEISHSKQAETGNDYYVMLFNNVKQLHDGSNQKVILAYVNLDRSQFMALKSASEDQVSKKDAESQKRRFEEAMRPIDEILNEVAYTSSYDEDRAPSSSYRNTSLPNIPPVSI